MSVGIWPPSSMERYHTQCSSLSVRPGWSCCYPCLGGVGSPQEKSNSSGLRRKFLLSSCWERLGPDGNFSSADGKCWPCKHWMRVTSPSIIASYCHSPQTMRCSLFPPSLRNAPLIVITRGFTRRGSTWFQFGDNLVAGPEPLHYCLPSHPIPSSPPHTHTHRAGKHFELVKGKILTEQGQVRKGQASQAHGKGHHQWKFKWGPWKSSQIGDRWGDNQMNKIFVWNFIEPWINWKQHQNNWPIR